MRAVTQCTVPAALFPDADMAEAWLDDAGYLRDADEPARYVRGSSAVIWTPQLGGEVQLVAPRE